MRLILRLVLLVAIIAVLYSMREPMPEDDYTYEPPGIITVEELPPIREENE